MTTFEVFNSHAVSTLKKEISKHNIKGYSKMRKADIIKLMIFHKDMFGHIVKKEKIKKEKKTQMKVQETKPKPPTKPTIKNKFYNKKKNTEPEKKIHLLYLLLPLVVVPIFIMTLLL